MIIIPTWCPICKLVMKGDKSNISYFKYRCCKDCVIEFVEGNEASWLFGTRPSKERVEKYLLSLDKE